MADGHEAFLETEPKAHLHVRAVTGRVFTREKDSHFVRATARAIVRLQRALAPAPGVLPAHTQSRAVYVGSLRATSRGGEVALERGLRQRGW